jgi:hypothetical protein
VDRGICGLILGGADTLQACVARASSAFGGRCLSNAQCQGGFCCDGVCSGCCAYAPCPEGQECGFPANPNVTDPIAQHLPKLCAPGTHLGASRDPCISNADCASNVCAGAALDCGGSCDGGRCSFCVTPRVTGGTCR